eukprot:216310-Alexandrium_andersonii.AAC.1
MNYTHQVVDNNTVGEHCSHPWGRGSLKTVCKIGPRIQRKDDDEKIREALAEAKLTVDKFRADKKGWSKVKNCFSKS